MLLLIMLTELLRDSKFLSWYFACVNFARISIREALNFAISLFTIPKLAQLKPREINHE